MLIRVLDVPFTSFAYLERKNMLTRKKAGSLRSTQHMYLHVLWRVCSQICELVSTEACRIVHAIAFTPTHALVLKTPV